MGIIPSTGATIPQRRLGIECAHKFGDCVLNTGLIREASTRYGCKIGVAVRDLYADAFISNPHIDEIVRIHNMGEGPAAFKKLGYKSSHIATQNIRFFEFKAHGEHSLIDTPLMVGKGMGLREFNHKPELFLSQAEIESVSAVKDSRPIIAIESVFTSGQSWATPDCFSLIVDKLQSTHKILWLSNQGAPNGSNIDNMLRFSRRQVIAALRHVDVFFSVGSGFFCSTLGLDRSSQPKKIVCLWNDDMYRYKDRLNELKWHPDITWCLNREAFLDALCNIKS